MRHYQAADELHRIATLSAFTVRTAHRRKLNQHATLYTFSDGSKLEIFFSRGFGSAWHPCWTGSKDDIEFGPIQNLPLRINH